MYSSVILKGTLYPIGKGPLMQVKGVINRMNGNISTKAKEGFKGGRPHSSTDDRRKFF